MSEQFSDCPCYPLSHSSTGFLDLWDGSSELPLFSRGSVLGGRIGCVEGPVAIETHIDWKAPVTAASPVEIFFSYAHEDEALMHSVRRQLVIYERLGQIVKWHDRQIPPGEEWASTIDERLHRCHIVLLFVSPAFIESRYCSDIEVGVALARHERREARVIPVILRPCAWEIAPFGKLQALPRDGKPVSQWPDQDQVCLDIAKALMTVVEEIQRASGGAPPPPISDRDVRRKDIARRMLPGDRIARLMAPFRPPTGVNIPAGYQGRLNYIAAEIVRESVVRRPEGGYLYPVHVVGRSAAIRAFEAWVASVGELQSLGQDETDTVSHLWFDYVGNQPPRAMSDSAVKAGLEVKQCGATLIT